MLTTCWHRPSSPSAGVGTSFAASPSAEGVVGVWRPAGTAHRALEHRGVERGGPDTVSWVEIPSLQLCLPEHLLCSLNRR